MIKQRRVIIKIKPGMRKAALMLLAAVVLGVSGAFCATGDSGQPGAFLNWGAGARSLGMGKAFTGLADDATAVYWNPAGLTKLNSNELVLLHAVLFEDTTYEFFGFAYPTVKTGTFGLGISYLRSGGFESRDISNQVLGTFEENDLAIFLSYGIVVFDRLSAGSSLKIVNQTLGVYSDTAFGLDVACMYTPFDFVSLGFVFENLIPPKLRLINEPENYPYGFKLGSSFKIFDSKLIIDVDADQIGSRDVKLHGGVEYSPYEFIALRAGIDETEITGGLGFRYKGYGIDYALSSQSLGLSHRISLIWSFGSFELEVEVTPKKFSPFGNYKTAEIRLKGAGRYGIKKWELNIRNRAGNLVKSFSGLEQPSEIINWGGDDEKGRYVPDGRYTIELKLVDKVGKTETAADSVEIESAVPGANIRMDIQ